LKGILFLQDNAAPHEAAITHHKLSDHRFEVLKHSAFSYDFAPSDYHLFPSLKNHLEERKFHSNEEATLAAEEWFAAQSKDFFYMLKI
jgi:hypothetical protein